MVIHVREKTIIQRVSKISVYLARLFVKPTRQRDTTGNGATPLTKEEHPGSYAIAKISTITKSLTISYHFYFDLYFCSNFDPKYVLLKNIKKYFRYSDYKCKNIKANFLSIAIEVKSFYTIVE